MIIMATLHIRMHLTLIIYNKLDFGVKKKWGQITFFAPNAKKWGSSMGSVDPLTPCFCGLWLRRASTSSTADTTWQCSTTISVPYRYTQLTTCATYSIQMVRQLVTTKDLRCSQHAALQQFHVLDCCLPQSWSKQLRHVRNTACRKQAQLPKHTDHSVIWSFTWCGWPHQSCWSTCAAIGLVGLQSSKKPIRDCFSRCRPFLKLFTVLEYRVPNV